jgi:hypothetical protein
MRKSLIAMAAAAFLLTAVNLYACNGKGNVDKSKADNGTKKADMVQAGGSCSMDAKTSKADLGQTGGAKTMTAESHSCPYMEGAQQTSSQGNCCSMSKEGKASSTSLKDSSKAKKNGKDSSVSNEKSSQNDDPVVVMGSPIDLSATAQK